MNKKCDKPDLTWQNMKTVMRSNYRTRIVLSCRDCPEGVSPKSSLYGFLVLLLSVCLAFLLFELLRDAFMRFLDWLTPDGCGELVSVLIHVIVVLPWLMLISLIVILLTFRFWNWIPASSAETDDKC